MGREKLAVNIKKDTQSRKSILIGHCWQEIAACVLLYIWKKKLKYENFLESCILFVVWEQEF